ncbi:MAG TPA: acetamidase/formamidase family protein [Trueperaceae bacterium]
MATHEYRPATYHNTFAAHPVALEVAPGDLVRTSTVDARGRGATGESEAAPGNPLTGPIRVAGAEPGDAVGVRIVELTPNRDTGWASHGLAPVTLEPDHVAGLASGRGDAATWRVDVAAGTVTPLEPVPGLEGLTLPLAPMLGCIGVAPAGGQAISTATSGEHGGNMDYRGVAAGTTVYLPVFVPGALVFVGDGHAVQGAGELAGTGVETSMDVVIELGLVKDSSIRWPRGEDPTHMFTLGNARPLDQAAQHAITEMVRWLTHEHGLSFEAASVLIGQAADLEVGNMFDPAYTVVCRLAKDLLPRRGA